MNRTNGNGTPEHDETTTQKPVNKWASPLPLDAELPVRTTDCMPPYKEIPLEFRRPSHPWVKWQQEWFFNGLKRMPEGRKGINGKAAMRHLKHIQRSWDTQHEHKEAAVAYLASLWLRPESA